MRLLFLLCAFWQTSWTISKYAYIRNPAPCPENMSHYVDDKNQSIVFCDCKETLLYFPENDFCYDAYRQGPCPSEHYLVLDPGETVAKCKKNVCLLDGLVPFKDNCYFLWESELPCEKQFHKLTVNIDTFELECSQHSYNGGSSNLKKSKSCPENSILVPLDNNESKWDCDCDPGFLRHAKNNSCHQAFRQGPCPQKHYFILPLGEDEARCEKNPCLEDSLVPFKEGCHKIFKFGSPCSSSFYYLGIDKKSFQLKCIYSRRRSGGHGAGGIITAPLKACPPGSRRIVTGCKRVFQ
ncbi:uncharacterized protein LOC122498508 [Leptopilina heterotoma]|uniref:uncharacterized protein LOC122498508 n=1 Tax=Leptopilina heterotoma TaxID=63436 RepID=UPI001CA8BF20|nr:uncharacterized protein LOC122498508 [Leptopilina heterotoma]